MDGGQPWICAWVEGGLWLTCWLKQQAKPPLMGFKPLFAAKWMTKCGPLKWKWWNRVFYSLIGLGPWARVHKDPLWLSKTDVAAEEKCLHKNGKSKPLKMCISPPIYLAVSRQNHFGVSHSHAFTVLALFIPLKLPLAAWPQMHICSKGSKRGTYLLYQHPALYYRHTVYAVCLTLVFETMEKLARVWTYRGLNGLDSSVSSVASCTGVENRQRNESTWIENDSEQWMVHVGYCT